MYLKLDSNLAIDIDLELNSDLCFNYIHQDNLDLNHKIDLEHFDLKLPVLKSLPDM